MGTQEISRPDVAGRSGRVPPITLAPRLEPQSVAARPGEAASKALRQSDRPVRPRVVILVSADLPLRQRLRNNLAALRWNVRETSGGAEAMVLLDSECPEAMIVDNWLPDLEVGEFVEEIEAMCLNIDMVRVDGAATPGAGARSPRRNELFHALRMAQEPECEWTAAVVAPVSKSESALSAFPASGTLAGAGPSRPASLSAKLLPEMVGESPVMVELARTIRLVAPRNSTVLIEGETGTGKEVVARAVHRLSLRAGKPFVVLNCAAIPEALLEAELFGHTRGAFTGAVTSRKGRIETADGGTLFLDEIGEMPLALQAKMLRFLESGELQKVGENDSIRVDVRVIAATHQELERRAVEKTFRLDLYHRLAVFPLEVPALRERMEDLPLLVDFFLDQMGKDYPHKTISAAALRRLAEYHWPGNIRELMHVLERGAILSENRPQIATEEIRVRLSRTAAV